MDNRMLYKMVQRITVIRGIIIAAIGATIAALLTMSTTQASRTIIVGIVIWFGQWGFLQWFILILFAIFLALSLLLLILVVWQQRKRDLQFYLRTVVYDNETVGPRGVTSQATPLISVDLPLDTVFISLTAIPNRPRFDSPTTQQDLERDLSTNPSLSSHQREELLGSIAEQWHTQPSPESVSVDQFLLRLDSKKPAAIVLGSPGSGKSTVLRWLALKMAQGKLSPHTPFLETLSPGQIPILIRISDYASRLSQEENLPFRQFLGQYLREMYPEPSALPNILLDEFAAGNCLFLLDGLDEAADDALRKHVADLIYNFIRDSASKHPAPQNYNRFVISSRIASYESGKLDQFAHYTLCDLSDQQINDFLKIWCPAVERHQLTLAGKVAPHALIAFSERNGMIHYQQLVETLQKNPNIKRLAVNPLMLTIMALIQRQGIPLPRRRIDLYRVVTRTLLESWNRDSLHPAIPRDEIQLAEIMLSNLAYRLHTVSVLGQEEASEIARQTMAGFYQLPEDQVSDSTQFIDRLRISSGLFIKAGHDVYSFMHRTFREYFVALYLRPKPIEELKLFIKDHYRSPVWREPLLLLIAYKGGSNNRNEVPQANELIRALALSRNEFDDILCHRLLFAASSIIDCNVWSIDKTLQKSVTHLLLDRYGACFTLGRYTQLQKEIERVMHLWLRAQPQAISQSNLLPALLDTWRTALCDDSDATRQEGAARLLAVLAPDLPECPLLVMQALLPPLLSLAHLAQSPSYPDWVTKEVQNNQTITSSLRVQDYACIALRRLGPDGPAGWLRHYWLKEQQETPFFENLTEHSQECRHLLTPVALPGKRDSDTWNIQRSIREQWQKMTQDELRHPQRELLESSEIIRYPYAYLLEQLLLKEQSGDSWHDVWYCFLREEMMRGHIATYQLCLTLRIIISSRNDQRRQETLEEFMAAIAGQGIQHELALLTITRFYLQDIQSLRHLPYPFFLHHTQYEQYRAFLQERQKVQTLLAGGGSVHQVEYLHYMLGYLPDIQELEDRWDLRSLHFLLDRSLMLQSLCNRLQRQTDISPMVLLALYSLLTSASKKEWEEDCKKVRASIDAFKRNGQLLQTEHHLLLLVLDSQIDTSKRTHQTRQTVMDTLSNDKIVDALDRLSYLRRKLSAQEVEMLLDGCANTQSISDDTSKRFDISTVHQFAWNLLTHQFDLEMGGLSVIISALDDASALKCAAAALLLQYNQSLSQYSALYRDAALKIAQILKDVPLSCRFLDPPDNSRTRRLDDVLFETLKIMEVS
jgi:hypothetical protein